MAAKNLEIELGRRIKYLREQAKLSQFELARLAGKSVETISNFERGKTLPSIRTLSQLAKHLECDVSDFFKSSAVERQTGDERTRLIASKLKLIEAKDRVLLEEIADLLARRGSS